MIGSDHTKRQRFDPADLFVKFMERLAKIDAVRTSTRFFNGRRSKCNPMSFVKATISRNSPSKFGFDADKVRNHPQNAKLREAGQLSADPNILRPTDMLYIPDSAPPVTHRLTTGTTNTFVSDVPTVDVNLRFIDPDLPSQPFTVSELPDLTDLTTDADGAVTLEAPVTLRTLTVVFTSDGTTFTCGVGDLDPMDTAAGVAHRLQNLGYLDSNVDYGISDLARIREALRAFRADQAAASDPSPPDSSSDDASDDDASDDDASDDDASDDDASDHAGLDDDGVLDEDTAELLKAAHEA